MNSLKQMQHRHRLTGADFHTPKTRGLLSLLTALCIASFILYLAGA